MISKRTLSYLALEAALVSCAPETVDRAPAAPVNWNPVTHAPTTSGPPRATAKERSAADAYAAALGGASLERLGAVLDEDAHFAFAGMKDAHGRDQVVAAHAALFAAFDERVLSPTRVWLTDSSQGVEWTLTGTHARTWMGVPATGHRVSVKGLSLLWTRDDGSINDVHVIFDEEVVRVQLGLPRKELASVASVAPGTGAPSRETLEQARTPEEEANVATVRAALNALENGNEAEYLGAFAADVAVDDPESLAPRDARGKGAVKGEYRALRKGLDQLDTAVDNAFGAGPYVVAEYSVIGTQLTPLGWVPLQHDRLLQFSRVDIVELRAGKIARVWRYSNPAQVIEKP